MGADKLLNQILKSYFNPNHEDPSQYWASTLVEGIRREGDEYVFRLVFIPLIKERLSTSFTNHHNQNRLPQRGVLINTRVWNITHCGIIHQTGHVYRNLVIKMFPRTTLQLEVQSKQSFKKLFDLPCCNHLKSLLRLESYADNIHFSVFDNVKTDTITYDHVLIPCAEIARFYFFNSSNLIESLLTPGSLRLLTNQLYNPVKSSLSYDIKENEFHLLFLNKLMSRTDAAIVGRIAFSDVARHAALTMQDSLLDISTNSSYSYIKCPFPYEGKSNVKVGSIDFTFEGKRVLLVTEILTCSADFPFSKLVVVTDEEYINDSNSGQPGNKRKRKKSKTSKEPVLDIEALGDYDKTDIDISSFRNRFEKLNLKNIKTATHSFKSSFEKGGVKIGIAKKLSIKYHKGKRNGINRVNTSIVESDEIVINPYTKEELERLEQELKEKRFDNLYKIKIEFESRKYKTSFFQWIPASENSDFTYFINDPESIDSEWTFINYNEGRPRLGLCLHVSQSDCEFYLLEVQLKGKEKASLKLFALKSLEPLNEFDLEEVLLSIQKKKGKIGVEKKEGFVSILSDRFIVYRYNHYTNWKAHHYVDRIIKDVK